MRRAHKLLFSSNLHSGATRHVSSASYLTNPNKAALTKRDFLDKALCLETVQCGDYNIVLGKQLFDSGHIGWNGYLNTKQIVTDKALSTMCNITLIVQGSERWQNGGAITPDLHVFEGERSPMEFNDVMTIDQFLKNAAELRFIYDGIEVPCKPKEMPSGIVGWSGNKDVIRYVCSQWCEMKMDINISVKGSKQWRRE